MAKRVTNFFHGGCEDNKTINKIFSYGPHELEADHAFIQWVFPTITPSAFNHNSPVLTVQDIAFLKQDPFIIIWLNRFRVKMFEYWGIIPLRRKDTQLLHGHNGLRLSRAIECLTLFGIDIDYEIDMLHQLIDHGIVKPTYALFNDEYMPIWFIRRQEALDKARFI